MNISESKTDSLYYCNECNTDNIVELAWISQGGEPIIYKQTNIIKCVDCMEKGIDSGLKNATKFELSEKEYHHQQLNYNPFGMTVPPKVVK